MLKITILTNEKEKRYFERAIEQQMCIFRCFLNNEHIHVTVWRRLKGLLKNLS